ncbi:hypothetical protein [Parasulfitobacter algicola]|uniref:Lipoprotein n=1 Tax=Parasulfitobacter algicola TaxID=2614809 RepID=A0ABX2IUM2_9RHOB|nr:hypothetical protein [Sulfitobacter algicola]NSX56597.1 hypothetical protein [Sulfitobacter algicola]
MKFRYLFALSFLAIAACGSTSETNVSQNDPRIATLLTWPLPQYYANLRIAKRITDQCARYSYDLRLDSDIAEKRNRNGIGSVAALGQRNAIDLETSVKRRSFEAIHNVDLNGSNLCAAGDAERARMTPLSVLLVPDR